MKLTAWPTFAAAAALILLANAVALTGVHLNRDGEPESRLTLSQRELAAPWGWGMQKENSGLALVLMWRVAESGPGGDYFYYPYGTGFSGGIPEWLDAPRMAALGFDTSEVSKSSAGRRRYERQLPREVLLVLELAGPAWQHSLARARQNAERHEAARQANADSKEFAEKAKRAAEHARREEAMNSRLFVVDAGLDRAALRARYPDRGRYLILQGTVRPRLVTQDKITRVTGYVSTVAVTRINVPHALRPPLDAALRAHKRGADDPSPHFEAALAVGQRLEPWIESLSVTR